MRIIFKANLLKYKIFHCLTTHNFCFRMLIKTMRSIKDLTDFLKEGSLNLQIFKIKKIRKIHYEI